MSHALFETQIRRDPARERLAPMLSELSPRESPARRVASRVRPRRRSRRLQQACA